MTDPVPRQPESQPASQPESQPEPPVGPPHRDRVRAQLVVGVLLAALGFAVVTQVRSNRVDDSFAGQREQDLIDVLTGLSGTNQRAQDEITRLEAARAELQSASSRRQAALREAQSEADDLSVLAGVVPVTGPGIQVHIVEGDDGPISIDSFLDLVQELRSVGAEAMAVGGTGDGAGDGTDGEVRLVAQSSFEQRGGRLVVDGVELRSPYVLAAIGDPDTLAGALVFRGGPLEQLEDDGATVASDTFSTLQIDAVRAEASTS